MIFECTRHTMLPPEDKSRYKIPAKLDDLSVGQYLAPIPYIESTNDQILRLAKEPAADQKDRDQVEAQYDCVREHLTYKEGPLKGALKGLTDGNGGAILVAVHRHVPCDEDSGPHRVGAWPCLFGVLFGRR